jgi:hypothetical protein
MFSILERIFDENSLDLFEKTKVKSKLNRPKKLQMRLTIKVDFFSPR